jgi:hypothetical protein
MTITVNVNITRDRRSVTAERLAALLAPYRVSLAAKGGHAVP